MATESKKPDDEAARARALALLAATHQFPCHYAVTVIAFNREAVTEAVRRAARPADAASEPQESAHTMNADVVAEAEAEATRELEAIINYEARASKEGKYLSHRFAVRVLHAGEVLELYARLRALDGVVTLL